MIDTFFDVSNDLFTKTSSGTIHFEQGVYGVASAKASKRIANTLAVQREILVLSSSFWDQQQRTIRVAVQAIEESDGRLESTVAIILHADKEGGPKLRRWGREKGITVLSIDSTQEFANSRDVERSLAKELYSTDPFDITGPVSDDANFYGRREEAIDLARKLQLGQIRSCLGIRKIGKTSIVNRVLSEISDSHDCICLMIDCSRDEIWELSGAELMSAITDTAAFALTEKINYVNVIPAENMLALAEARKRLEQIASDAQKPLIIVFDEIDYVTPGSPTNPGWKGEFNSFWRNLRAAYQESIRLGNKMSILIAGVSAHWFTTESVGGIENAALSFVPEEYLSPMPQRATTAMLKNLGKVAGIQFEWSSLEAIADACGNMPYWSRKCCSYINRHIPVADRPCLIDPDRVNALLDSFVEEEGSALAEVALKHLFRVYPGLFDATSRCHFENCNEVPARFVRVLRAYGIVHPRESRLSGKMIVAGFGSLLEPSLHTNQEQTAGAETSTTRISDLSQSSLDEWADEIASNGKRRNILERKLRVITLDFLRFSLLNSQGGLKNLSGLKEKLLKFHPEAMRTRYTHLSAEDIVSKYNWTDLIALVSKEWEIFKQIFGDKGEFQVHCGVINDRPDCHAKDADGADIALMRRSLSWLEEKVARLQ
jgi:hypothetical protein